MPLFGSRGAASLTGFGGLAKLGYLLRNSLRFRSGASANLTRTPGVAGNQRTWTWSAWVKRGILTTDQMFFSATNTYIRFGNGTEDTLWLNFRGTGGTNYFFQTTQVFRDPAAWYHIVLAVDTTQATDTNRVKLYVNGSQITAFTTYADYPPQNTDTAVNATSAQALGSYTTGALYFDGYMAEIRMIDGQQLTPSSFAKTDAVTGQWIPIKYSGTYGTNGYYLPFSNTTSTSTLGNDFSGRGNTWTVNNISLTAGATYDSMTDVPTLTSATTANYAVLNPLDSLGGTVSNGNLEYSGTFASGASQNGHACRSTLRVPSSDKWYAEMAAILISGSGNSCMLGFTSSTQAITNSAFAGTLTPWIGVDASVFNNRILLSWNGVSGGTASETQLFASYASGDIVNIAIDYSVGKIWIGKNGTYYNSGNPSAGTNETSTFTAGSAAWAALVEYVASGGDANRSGAIVNFGQQPFAYTPPSGFKSLNTFNLP